MSRDRNEQGRLQPGHGQGGRPEGSIDRKKVLEDALFQAIGEYKETWGRNPVVEAWKIVCNLATSSGRCPHCGKNIGLRPNLQAIRLLFEYTGGKPGVRVLDEDEGSELMLLMSQARALLLGRVKQPAVQVGEVLEGEVSSGKEQLSEPSRLPPGPSKGSGE